MNEPSVFKTPTGTMPLDNRHDNDGQPTDHRALHNVYGMQMARATYEGLLRLRPDERPFVLSRASFRGRAALLGAVDRRRDLGLVGAARIPSHADEPGAVGLCLRRQRHRWFRPRPLARAVRPLAAGVGVCALHADPRRSRHARQGAVVLRSSHRDHFQAGNRAALPALALRVQRDERGERHGRPRAATPVSRVPGGRSLLGPGDRVSLRSLRCSSRPCCARGSSSAR